MKRATVSLAIIFQSIAVISISAAQSTVYDDNFGNDRAFSSGCLNINDISGPSDKWAFTAKSELTLTAAASGKADEPAGSFSPVSLVKAALS